jgi:hypothetical protein
MDFGNPIPDLDLVIESRPGPLESPGVTAFAASVSQRGFQFPARCTSVFP